MGPNELPQPYILITRLGGEGGARRGAVWLADMSGTIRSEALPTLMQTDPRAASGWAEHRPDRACDPEHGSKLSSWTVRPGQVLPSLSSHGIWALVCGSVLSPVPWHTMAPRHLVLFSPASCLILVKPTPTTSESSAVPASMLPWAPCLVWILHPPFRSRFSLDRAPLGKGGACSQHTTSHSKASMATKADTCEH